MAEQLALVIEDDDEIARFFEIILNEEGFDVQVITNGQTALDRLGEVVPDIMLLDLNLPGVSGVEILQRVRANDALAGVIVIVVSANPHMIEYAYDLADITLQKPVSYEQFRALIQRFT